MGSGLQIQVVRLGSQCFLPAEPSHQPFSFIYREQKRRLMEDKLALAYTANNGQCWHSAFKGHRPESFELFLYIVYLARGEWLRVKYLKLE